MFSESGGGGGAVGGGGGYGFRRRLSSVPNPGLPAAPNVTQNKVLPAQAPAWGQRFGESIYRTNLDNDLKGQLMKLGIAAQKGDPRAIEAYNKAIYGSQLDNSVKASLVGLMGESPYRNNDPDFQAFIGSLPSAHAARIRNAYSRSGMQGVERLGHGAAWLDAYKRWKANRGTGRKMGWERPRNPHNQAPVANDPSVPVGPPAVSQPIPQTSSQYIDPFG